MEQRELEAEAERRKWVHVWIQPTHSHDLNGPDNIRHLPIDDMVIAFIEERLMQGVQVHRISQMLRDHLQQTTTLRPDQLTTRRFCPTTKDIYNINLQAKAKRRLQQTIAQAGTYPALALGCVCVFGLRGRRRKCGEHLSPSAHGFW